jgi:hypothetical protein
MRRGAIVALIALGACSQNGTGVELTVEPNGIVLDELSIVAEYDGRQVPADVHPPGNQALVMIAQLPDESTTVTFDVTARDAGQIVGHGVSDPIAVTPHHLSTAVVMLAPSSGDGGTNVDGGGDSGVSIVWNQVNGVTPPAGPTITSIWGSSGGDVYATTSSTTANLLHSTDHGATWPGQLAGSAVALNGVGGSSPTDVYLAGDNATLLKGAGTSWTLQTLPGVPSTTRLIGVFAIAPGDVYVTGSDNVILHLVAGSWIWQTPMGTTVLTSVWGISGNIWAVGSGGVILHSTGNGSWTPDTSNTVANLTAVFGTGPTDVWAAGSGVVMHSSGNGSWSAASDGVPGGVTVAGLGGVPSGPIWGVGSSWTILQRGPTMWMVEPSGITVDSPSSDLLTSVFAASATEVFAGGAGLVILRGQ